MTSPYTTPAAFRRALTDRLRALAHPRGPWPLAELQRQFAYDRLRARLYHHDPEWVVKGATALLARELAVRRTVDIDLYRATIWSSFHVDLVAENIRMTSPPDDVPALLPLDIPGMDRPGYRAYPLVDHIADKTCAILERHGPQRRPSTRFKDLVDLVAVITQTTVPDQDLWERGYPAEARRSVEPLSAATLDEALAITGRFLNPLLDRTAAGVWYPHTASWEPPSA